MHNYSFKRTKRIFVSSLLIVAILTISLLSHTVDAVEVSYYVYDGPERSVVGITDVSGGLINQYSYDAHGNVISQVEGVPNNFGYEKV